MELTSEDRARLKAILEDLETSKIPIDLPRVERALIAILRALLGEQRDRTV